MKANPRSIFRRAAAAVTAAATDPAPAAPATPSAPATPPAGNEPAPADGDPPPDEDPDAPADPPADPPAAPADPPPAAPPAAPPAPADPSTPAAAVAKLSAFERGSGGAAEGAALRALVPGQLLALKVALGSLEEESVRPLWVAAAGPVVVGQVCRKDM